MGLCPLYLYFCSLLEGNHLLIAPPPDVANGKKYLRFTDKAALRFVNLYWPVLYKELLPFAAEGWDQFLRGILNKFFLKVPFSVIFPEA
jgi:hypothetical protein